jgi:hypothetical protein
MRSKNNSLKTVPFQPLKDSTGSAYAVTLVRFYVFARIFFSQGQHSNLKSLIQQATEEHCMANGVCCLEGFMYCLTVHAPNHKHADALQHAAMQMRRAIRGVALINMKDFSGLQVEDYCDKFLNPKRASAFGVLTSMYYAVKRCVHTEKRLLIHRTDPDEGYPPGSAVLVGAVVLISVRTSTKKMLQIALSH